MAGKKAGEPRRLASGSVSGSTSKSMSAKGASAESLAKKVAAGGRKNSKRTTSKSSSAKTGQSGANQTRSTGAQPVRVSAKPTSSAASPVRNSRVNGSTETIPAVKDAIAKPSARRDSSPAKKAAMPPRPPANKKPGASKPSGKRPHHRMAVLGVIAAIIVVALVGGGYGVAAAYAGSVKPGVSVGGTDVAGKSEDRVTQIVTQEAKSISVSVTENGTTFTGTAAQMGMNIDIPATVARVMSAGKYSGILSPLNFVASTDIPLVATYSQATLQTFLNSHLGPGAATDATVSYNPTKNSFIAQPGKNGDSANVGDVIAVLKQAAADPSHTYSVTPRVSTGAPVIPAAAARAAAEKANVGLALKLVVGNGSTATFTVPPSDIAAWTLIQPNDEAGTIDVAYDTKAMKQALPAQLTKALTQTQVNQVQVVMPDGSQNIKTKGVDGVKVTDTTAAVDKIAAGLTQGADVKTTVESSVVTFAMANTVDYSKPNGNHWMKLNLSTQEACAYAGSTPVNPGTGDVLPDGCLPVATGALSTKTASGSYTSTVTGTGSFFVQEQFQDTSMVNPTFGYNDPHIYWVSYFHSGDAFHAAPWNLHNIAVGQPSSHGCANMTTQDAQWVYHFINDGSLVQVVGTTPAQGVRGAGSAPSTGPNTGN